MTPRIPARLAVTSRALLVGLVTALVLAVSLVVVTPASHAAVQDTYRWKSHAKRSYQVWEAVAACESSHEWHINTHNGYYGGLQFLQATWVGFGGRKYAKRADLALRSEQIAVARRVLAAQGPVAWPVCSKAGHLNRRTGLATSLPLPSMGTARHRPIHKPVRQHHRPVHRHHEPVHPKHRKATYGHYRVRSGDTLSTIAAHFHLGVGRLWFYNQRVVPHGNLIVVGQVLRIPR